jgi:crotonobetainyl-CoA:carnitine CoA-transferase CaiB-like acyl-CoA transferase
MESKPLSHVRILEIGGYISMPYGTSLLCALGAEVVKVEKPGTGEDFRRGQNETSEYFVQYNAGKRSLGVDLKRPEGVELVRALVPRFDVVIQNLRPGKVAAMGLGPEDCRALRPDLVYFSISGFGSDGPLAQRPAYDTIGQAYGAYNTIFSDSGSPELLGTCIADLATGLSTAMGILAALVGRSASGQGPVVETSIMEATSLLSIDAITQYYASGHRNPTRESRHPQAQNFVLKTASGDSVAIHLSSSQKFWRCFTGAIGRPDLAEDPRFRNYRDREERYFELVAIAGEEIAKRPLSEWTKLLADADVPFAPVLTVQDYVTHEQTDHLQLMQPEKDGLALVGPPWRFDGERPLRASSAPRVGQDTRDIAGEVYDEASVDRLIEQGVLYADS